MEIYSSMGFIELVLFQLSIQIFNIFLVPKIPKEQRMKENQKPSFVSKFIYANNEIGLRCK